MITKWSYNVIGGNRLNIKNHISTNGLLSVDVGAAADFWSYPECKTTVDCEEINKTDVKSFKLNIENEDEWKNVLDAVERYGKFDFSICSHTLEDVFDPISLMKKLSQISYGGFIAIPSKFNEFRKLYNQKYRGNGHHKQFFDIKDNKLIIYPKFSWIEIDERSDKVLIDNLGEELSFTWENEIPYKLFNNEKIFKSDDEIMNYYYNEILISEK